MDHRLGIALIIKRFCLGIIGVGYASQGFIAIVMIVVDAPTMGLLFAVEELRWLIKECRLRSGLEVVGRLGRVEEAGEEGTMVGEEVEAVEVLLILAIYYFYYCSLDFIQ